MKHFLFVIFLFLAVFTCAQNLEEIYYVPSPSGHYTNLISKGDAYINILATPTFDIHSYGSLLTIRIKNETSKINIGTLNILQSNGTATFAMPSDTETLTTKAYAGFLSFSSSLNGLRTLGINALNLPQATTVLAFNARNIFAHETNNSALYVNNLSIYGMQVPLCDHGYYWQTVNVGGNSYTILACNTTTCTNPQDEENCVVQGRTWNVVSGTCSCI